MKTLLIKFGLIFIFLAFVDYVILALMGCLACIFSASENSFCNTYCWMIKIFAALTFALWLGWFIFETLKLKRSSD